MKQKRQPDCWQKVCRSNAAAKMGFMVVVGGNSVAVRPALKCVFGLRGSEGFPRQAHAQQQQAHQPHSSGPVHGVSPARQLRQTDVCRQYLCSRPGVFLPLPASDSYRWYTTTALRSCSARIHVGMTVAHRRVVLPRRIEQSASEPAVPTVPACYTRITCFSVRA
jgi:hypothetical protein